MEEIENKIKKEFETSSEKFVVLLDIPAEKYFATSMDSANFMSEGGKKGVYVTVSRPYRFISKEMQKRSINTDNLLFIDCISCMAGDYSDGTCTFVENPAALEEISMHIISLLDKIESDEKFLIMDSVSALLIYNGTNSVKEFLMFLINKLRLEKVNGILLVIGNDAPGDLKQILIAMCDKAIC